MRRLTMLGGVLIVVGVLALLFGHFSYTDTKPAAKLGPLQINTEEQHQVWIPTIAGIVIVIAGLGLIVVDRRSA